MKTITTTAAPALETHSATEVDRAAPLAVDPERAWTRNFRVLVIHQVANRTGWIFKTETVVIPAVLDLLSGSAWIRGWLPLLNRFGHTIPPLLLARSVTAAPLKKQVLFSTTAMYAVLMLCLAILFMQPAQAGSFWMPLCFLTIYTVFSIGVGLNSVVFNTLQGKLVATTRRGRLLLVSNLLGSILAIAFAWVLLPPWLSSRPPRFDLVFGFTGLMFALSAVVTWALVEVPDQYSLSRAVLRDYFWDAWSTFRDDRQFRHLALVGASFGMSLNIFPHYQNLGLKGLGLPLSSLMWWVVVQNIGTGLFSIPAGWIADRSGNRRVLQIALLGVAGAPLSAVVLSMLGAENWYGMVFLLLGVHPVVLRTLQNFTLEIAAPADHPRYLSTLSLWMGVPLLLSPLVGLGVDLLGFSAVFLLMAAVVLVGWVLTFWMREPRDHVSIQVLETSHPGN